MVRTRWGKQINALCVLLIIWVVILSNSRTGLVVAGVTIAVSFFGLFKSKVIAVVVMVVLAGLFLFAYPIVRELPEVSQLQERWESSDVLTASGRVGLVKNSLSAFEDTSVIRFLVGAGTHANYKFLADRNTHNSYLEFLLDHGVVGVGLLIGLLFVAAQNSKRKSSVAVATSMRAIWLVLAVGSIVLSPFAFAWAWVAWAPLLVSPAPKLQPERVL
jgi:O-antigen ligase